MGCRPSCGELSQVPLSIERSGIGSCPVGQDCSMAVHSGRQQQPIGAYCCRAPCAVSTAEQRRGDTGQAKGGMTMFHIIHRLPAH
jgi:hypothetical protein